MRYLSGHADDGDDLAQQVLLRAWRGIGKLHTTAAFDGWLRRIMVTTWIDQAKRRKRRLLVLKVIFVCAAVGVVGLVSPWLADLAVTVTGSLSAAFAAFDLPVIVLSQLSAAFAAFDRAIGGIDRAAAVVVGLFLIVRRYGFPSFRLRIRGTQT